MRVDNAFVVPDTFTGVFDPLGAFTQPNFIALNLQLTYDVSPRITLTGVLANIVNTCWGGTQSPWTFTERQRLRVQPRVVSEARSSRSGTCYNPPGFHGSIVQPLVKFPYNPLFGPFNQDGTPRPRRRSSST